MLLTVFKEIEDHRKGRGKIYELEYILFFSVLAILSDANTYREIAGFIKTHFKLFEKKYKLKWWRSPSYSCIRRAIQGLSKESLENAFRKYSKKLAEEKHKGKLKAVAFDGKTLRKSFDNCADQKAIQVLSAFLTESDIIIAHEQIEEKTNEIPTAQELIEELNLTECIFTFDALNTQKNS